MGTDFGTHFFLCAKLPFLLESNRISLHLRPRYTIKINTMETIIDEITLAFQSGRAASWEEKIIIILAIIIFSYLSTKLFRSLIIPAAKKLTQRTKATWDDYLFNENMLNSFCKIIPPIVWYAFLPMVFQDMPLLLNILQHVCLIYLVIVTLILVKAFLDSVYEISSKHERFKNRPLKGIYQMIYLLALSVGIVIIISIIIDKDPTTILTGLGASAAILMLVFKDTILGLVAGIQLSANDMLRPGDWITIPKSGVDGNVLEVSLTTIKVQNFDKTIITIPPYVLVSESFQNWRGMQEAGGRRIKRSLLIDMNTVHFCSKDDLLRYQKEEWIHLDTSECDKQMVNLEVFRIYLQNYLKNHPKLSKELTVLVRELQPGPEGMPIELYCFTDTTNWLEYENIQCEIFGHLLAILPEFGLRAYQRFTGSDYK